MATFRLCYRRSNYPRFHTWNAAVSSFASTCNLPTNGRLHVCFSTSKPDPPANDDVSTSNKSTPQARNFSFSGSGFLISYHLGVAKELQNAGYIQPASKFAGASGGAITALALAANVNVDAMQEAAKALAALCRSEGTWWKLEVRLRTLFHQLFAQTDVEKLTDRLTITTEQLWPKRQVVHSSHFHSADDLCDALIASCYVPFYLSPSGMTRFRGEFHVDGGLLKLVPEVPGYVRVCAFHAHLLRRPDYELSPSIDKAFPFTIFHLTRFALFPPEPKILDQLYELGTKTAAIWVKKQQEASRDSPTQ